MSDSGASGQVWIVRTLSARSESARPILSSRYVSTIWRRRRATGTPSCSRYFVTVRRAMG